MTRQNAPSAAPPDEPEVQKILADPRFKDLSPEDQNAVSQAARDYYQSQKKAKEAAKEGTFSGPSSMTKPDSIVGGGVRRLTSAAKGLHETFKPPEKGNVAEQIASGAGGPGGLAVERQARGAFEGMKSKAIQTGQDIANKDYEKAILHGAEISPTSPIGPLSPAQSLVDMAEEGRYKEALGAGLFDLITTFAGGKLLGAHAEEGGMKFGPTPRQAANKLRLATKAPVDDIRAVLPDLKQTAEIGGKPTTVADVQHLVRDTTNRLTNEFDQDFSAIANRRIYTPFIKHRLNKILADNPQWARTPDGLAKIKAIKAAIKTYDKVGWTFNEMNKERGDLRTSIQNLYDMAPADERAALRKNPSIAAKEAVADVMAETVNDWTANATGKPKTYYDQLRRKQATLINLEKWLDGHIEDLHNKQAEHEGLGPAGRFKFHAYASPGAHGVVRAHLSGLREMVSPGPEAIANQQVRQAFASSKHPIAGSTILSLPAETLNQTHGTANPPRRKETIPPPPEPQ